MENPKRINQLNFLKRKNYFKTSDLPPVRIYGRDKQLTETRNEMKKIGYQILAMSLGGLVVAIATTLMISIIKHAGDTTGAINSWHESLGKKTADGLQPAATVLALDAVMVAIFISVSAGSRPRKTTRTMPHVGTSIPIMIDKTVSFTLLFGCIASWLLTEISPSPEDPRSLNTIIPVASAFLCATLSRLADESAESRKIAQTEASIREKNLRSALRTYRKSVVNSPQLPTKPLTEISWQKTFPIKWVIIWDALPLLGIPLAIYSQSGSTTRLGEIAGITISLAALTVISQINLIESTAENHILNLSHGRSGATWPHPVIFLPALFSVISSLMVALISPPLSIPIILLSCATLGIYHTTKRDPGYLIFILRKIEFRLGLDKPSGIILTRRKISEATKCLRKIFT
ncbi:hypothetical protein SAMN05421595_2991 [Austwickia chelonae]|uniref:hypothetical protein n=1 Tax=Austwickia chelonae TaxID=100225 RepID=UPI0008AD1547|nr:hypothetical protein [Austwickia chelonae]SEW42531.1 hypothetical protein SAMN05421595_2991 [Austwickia chelonae]